MREQFLKHLRDGLNHLRDPNYLRQSPLTLLFGVANQSDTPAALRHILIDAVKSLRPEDDEPAQSPAWRLYESLFYRYVQYFSQIEVADQLGISPRQLRREQRAALETLAYQLWQQFDVETKLREDMEEKGDVEPPGTTTDNTVYEDLAWLEDAPPERATGLDQELPTVLSLVRPLAVQHGVRLDMTMDDGLPQLATNPVAFRQTLLSLLGVAIPKGSSCGWVSVSARSLPREVQIEVRCGEAVFSPQPVPGGDAASLDMAQRLANLYGGELTVSADAESFCAVLTLPALGRLPVLAVDDNASTLQLLRRYTAGTRYHLVGTQDPEEVLSLVEEFSPQIIVLDVMMPRMDGWEVLGRLRQHPLAAHIPIIVCTILAEEGLALSLGASDFMRKPVTRQVFLAALDRQVALPETESRPQSGCRPGDPAPTGPRPGSQSACR